MDNINNRLDKLFENLKKTDVNIVMISAYLKHITEKIEDLKINSKDNEVKYEKEIEEIKESIEKLNIEVDRIKVKTETTWKVLKIVSIVLFTLISTYMSFRFYFG